MRRTAEIGMLLVTLLWGANFVVGKLILESTTPLYYSSIRFVGATILLGLLYHQRLRNIDKSTLKAGALIGIALGIGYILQTVGLNYTTASKAGFLTGLFVVLVPLFESIIRRRMPHANELFGILLATIGLGVLSLNSSFAIGFGDAMVFLGAVSFSISIVLISHFAKDHDPISLTVIQIAVTAVLSLASAVLVEPIVSMEYFDMNLILLLLFAILFGTAVNTAIQNWAQSKISATSASVILVLEPVAAGIFAYLILHDTMGIKELTGCIMIITGMLVTLLLTPKNHSKSM
ncbi:hypothetical protein N752_12555 [Desulforamulus aquiferis]|nr:hypothetical protein N752_12555 [Desulforamulus aquiferis]